METKATPGPHSCYAAAEPDEPLFILLGRDKHAPTLVWLWAVLRELDGEKPETVKDARDCVTAMIEWAAAHGRKTVGLGQSALAAVLELIRMANHAVQEARNEQTGVNAIRMFLAQTTFEEPKD